MSTPRDPSSASGPTADESGADLSQLRVRGTVKAAGALAGMSGAIGVLTGVQFTTSLSFEDATLNAVPWALAALGGVQVVLAILVLRNHFPGAVACALVSAVVALVAVGWLALAWTHGFISCFAICEVPLAGSAAILTPLALVPVRRAWVAKQRLSESGIELGF